MIKYFVPDITLGNWITIFGGVAIALFTAGFLRSEFSQAQASIKKNEQAIEKITNMKEIVIRLEERQKIQTQQIDLLVNLIKKTRTR